MSIVPGMGNLKLQEDKYSKLKNLEGKKIKNKKQIFNNLAFTMIIFMGSFSD